MGYWFQEEEKIEEEVEPQPKRMRIEGGQNKGSIISLPPLPSSTLQFQTASPSKSKIIISSGETVNNRVTPRRIETGFFSNIPPEIYHHILKFLSSEVMIFI